MGAGHCYMSCNVGVQVLSSWHALMLAATPHQRLLGRPRPLLSGQAAPQNLLMRTCSNFRLQKASCQLQGPVATLRTSQVRC